jgi:hypothetical protein
MFPGARSGLELGVDMDDAEGEEGNDLDSLDEEVVQPHLELEGDVDDVMTPCKRSNFYCSALSLLAISCSSHPSGI